MFRKSVHFTVNGQFVELTGSQVFAPFSDTLRYLLRKTGTKVVCAEGDCGACTIMVARASQNSNTPLSFRSMNSCILPSFLADACHIVSVEGLSCDGDLHEIQKSMMRNFGGQCGFCTPGFVMSIANLYEHKETPSTQNIKNYLTGNLCRCTGYQPIIEAAQDVKSENAKTLGEMYPLKNENKELLQKTQKPLLIEIENRHFFGPATIEQAVSFKNEHPYLRIFSGATDLGVQINKGKDPGPYQMSLHLIEDLYKIEIDEKSGKVHVGAKVSLDKLQKSMEKYIPAFGDFLNIFASPQIKNSATLVGNLANGSPIADTLPFLLCMDATVELAGIKGKRSTPVTDFFKGYKNFDIEQDEIITGISFDFSPSNESKLALYKISQRRDLDISCINSCFLLKEKNGKVEDLKLAFGGVGPVPLRLHEVEKQIKGWALNPSFVSAVKKLILESIQPISDVRGTEEFRKNLAISLFDKFAKEQLGL